MTEALCISMPVDVERTVETAANITAAIAPGDRQGAARDMHRHWSIVN